MSHLQKKRDAMIEQLRKDFPDMYLVMVMMMLFRMGRERSGLYQLGAQVSATAV